jgi:2-methylcitrate dehydratase PrpD
LLAGCEIGARLGSVETPPFFASGRWAGVGAAVAGGICLGLDQPTLANAIALAVHAAPLLAPAGARKEMTGHLKEGVPFGVLSGVACAFLAEQGYRGDPDAIESTGIYDVVRLAAQGRDAAAFGRTYFKRYSCCRLAHSPIDAALAIQSRERLAPRDITKITVRTFRTAVELPNEARPASFESAQYSLPFAIAVALVLGADALLPLYNETLANNEVCALAERVELMYDPMLDSAYPAMTPTEVRIVVRRGQTYIEERDTAEGDPARAFSDEQLLLKLRTLAKGRISPRHLDAIAITVGGRIPSARELEAVLRKAHP